MTDKPTRRELMKPLHLLGLALLAAVFAGVVALISLGFFQDREPGQAPHALLVGAIVAGITFIVTLVVIALLLLVVDPAEVARPIDGPVLIPNGGASPTKNGAASDGTDVPPTDAAPRDGAAS